MRGLKGNILNKFTSDIIKPTKKSLESGHTLFTLPKDSLVTKISFHTKTPDEKGEFGGLRLEVDGSFLIYNLFIKSAEDITLDINKRLPSGGIVKLLNGREAVRSRSEIKIVVDYFAPEVPIKEETE